MAERVALGNTYRKTVMSCGLDSFFDAGRLEKDRDMAQSRQIIACLRAADDAYEKDILGYPVKAEQKIRAADLPKKDRDEMLEGFREGRARGMQTAQALLALERQAVDELEAIVNLLSERKKWTVENDEITFYDDNDIDRYNAHIEKIQSLDQKLKELQRRAFTKVDQELEALKH
jgi:hypothetical protein